MRVGRDKSVQAWPALYLVALVIIAGPLGCDSLFQPADDNGEVSFSHDVQPILTTNCAGCHSPGGGALLRGTDLDLREDTSYGLLVDQPSAREPSLTLVVPGDADASLLVAKVSSDTPPVGERMPRRAPPLTADEISLIRDWIDQGALDN